MHCRTPFLTLTAVAAVLAMTTGHAARADEAVYQRVVKSTVLIATPSEHIGAGTFIDADRRLVITANHVLGTDDNVLVYFADRGTDGQPITELNHYAKNRERLAIRATVVARDPDCDLALIRLESVPKSAVPLPIAAEARPGESVHALGHSSYKRNAVFSYSSKGVVRNVYNIDNNTDLHLRGRIVETSLPTNHGDSGGPVVNDRGELVAVVSRGTTGAAAPAGNHFADEQVVDLDISNTEVRRLLTRSRLPETIPAPSPVVLTTPPAFELTAEDMLALQNRIRQRTLTTMPPAPQPLVVDPLPVAPRPVFVDPVPAYRPGPEQTIPAPVIDRAPPPMPKPGPVVMEQRSIVGRWNEPAVNAGDHPYTWIFEANGTVRLKKLDDNGNPVQQLVGKFEYSNTTSVLVVKFEGQSMSIRVSWVGTDEISVSTDSVRNTWKRQP